MYQLLHDYWLLLLKKGHNCNKMGEMEAQKVAAACACGEGSVCVIGTFPVVS